jgi:uncharacterized protein (DUF885 family)
MAIFRRVGQPQIRTGFPNIGRWAKREAGNGDWSGGKMRLFWRVTLIVLALVLIVGGYAGYRTLSGKPFAFNHLLDRQLAYFLLDDPETLTSLGMVDGGWLDFHSDSLTELSLAKRASDAARLHRYIAQIKEWDRAELDPQEQISYDMALQVFEAFASYDKYDWLGANGDLYPINQIGGIHIGLPNFMQFQHKVSNGLTARNYVSRLRAMGVKIDAAEKDLVRQASLGVVPPDFILDKTISGLTSFLSKTPDQNALVAAYKTRLAKLTDVSAEEQAQLNADALAAVRDVVYPAYQRLRARLQELRKTASHDAGVWRLKQGDEFYAARLRDMTTTTLTADEIHAYGLSEVARITAEMDAILKSQGLNQGTVGERMDKLRLDPRFALQNNPTDRERVLSIYRADTARAMALAPQYFSRLPKAPVEVHAVPEFAQEGSAGAYYEQPALDGTRPGRVFVNLRDVGEWPIWAIHSTAFHEGVPGHHFQIALSQELEGLPMLRKLLTPPAFAEGWALYSELLSKEMGLYKDDPFGDLGRLNAELFRAVRLVVDTGMHAKRWSREQAITYMRDTTGNSEGDVTAEIERYVVWPGQACAYKLGMRSIMAMRDKARSELGSRFDIKTFHAAVLENGGLPLNIFETNMNNWIAAQKGAPQQQAAH